MQPVAGRNDQVVYAKDTRVHSTMSVKQMTGQRTRVTNLLHHIYENVRSGNFDPNSSCKHTD